MALPLIFSQTILERGDVAVLGVNANNSSCGGGGGEDIVSLVFFKDLEPGTEFIITDNGYERIEPGKWGNVEGVFKIKLKESYSSVIPKGTILRFKFPSVINSNLNPYCLTINNSNWEYQSLIPNKALNLKNGGDQLYVLSTKTVDGTNATWDNGTNNANNALFNGVILYAFSTSRWESYGNSSQKSGLHPDVEPCNFMNPASTTNFLIYNGSLQPASQLEWIERIKNPDNWGNFSNCVDFNDADDLESIQISEFNETLKSTFCTSELPYTLPIVDESGITGYWTNGQSEVVTEISQSESLGDHTYTFTTTLGQCSGSTYAYDFTINTLEAPSSPSLRGHYVMCEGQASSFSHWSELNQILANYDISLVLDNGDGIYQEGVDIVKYDIFLEDNSILASDLSVLVESFSLQTGDYFVIVYDNDKGGHDSNGNYNVVNTGGNNDLNENYNGCEYIFPTKLTVYNSREGLLGLQPSVDDNTICLTDTRDFYITLDGNSHSDGFILYEEVSQNNDYGNPISYQNDAYGNPISYNYQFQVISQTPLNGYTEVIDDVIETDGLLSIVGTGTATVKLTIYTPHPDGSPNIYCNEEMEIEITVEEGTAPTFAAIPAQCEGGSNPLPSTSNNGITGTWSPAFNPDVTTTYTFTPNAGQCASSGVTLTVTIYDLNVDEVIVDSDCAQDNGSINITVSGGSGNYTYAWTGPDNFTSINEDVSGLEPGTYNLIVTDTLGDGDSSNDCITTVFTYVIEETGQIISYNSADIQTEFCSIDADYALPDGFFDSNVGAIPGTWHLGSSTGTVVEEIDISEGSASYYFVPNAGCYSPNEYEIEITVTPSPIAGTISGNNEICESDTKIYTVSGNSADGIWSIESSTPSNIATITAIDATSASLEVTGEGEVIIEYTVEGSAPCSGISASFTVDVVSVPNTTTISYD